MIRYFYLFLFLGCLSSLQALPLFERAFQQGYAENLNNAAAKSFAYGYLGQLYENDKRYDDALLLTRQALFSAQKIRELSKTSNRFAYH